MIRKLFACLTVAAFATVGVAQEGTKLPQEPGPRFLVVTKIDKDDIELKQVLRTLKDGLHEVHIYQVKFQSIKICQVNGKKLVDPEEFRKQAKVGTVVLAAADEHEIDRAYLSVLKDDTLLMEGVIVGSSKAK
ncbi:MAG: hypothetical protein K2X38_17985 [Gemmataceae bacterium]|nr:hypothetical protein [Gemmataceae bacterium]